MKRIKIRKLLVAAFHVMFWALSFNYWNTVLNPGVSSMGVINGMEADWDIILPLNLGLLLYLALPFVWLGKKIRLWIKLPATLLFLLPIAYLIVQAIYPDGNQDDVKVFVDYFLRNFMYVVVFHLSLAAAVYLNLNILIRKYLNQGHFRKYILNLIGLIVLTAIVNFSLYNYFLDRLFPELFYISYFKVWELMLIVCGYLVLTGGLFLTGQYAQMLIEKREAAQNELLALKAQINPHFLFNNLNTIYSMAAQKDQRTTDVILKLSDFLRYVLYDTSAERIPLGKEVEMIQTYVGLQKERIDPKVTKIELETSGDFSEAEIAPLLLLPLAENCFKHGVGKSNGTIRIFIRYANHQLTFGTENKIARREKTESGEIGGVGIPNVAKRLALIYPDCHTLNHEEKDDIFRLELKIDLK